MIDNLKKKKDRYETFKVIGSIVDLITIFILIKICWGLPIFEIIFYCFFASPIILINGLIGIHYDISIKNIESKIKEEEKRI